MLVIDLVRKLPDLFKRTESGVYQTFHVFDVKISQNDYGISFVKRYAPITIGPILLLGYPEPEGGTPENSRMTRHEDMVIALKTRMESPINLFNKQVTIRVSEQCSFNGGDDEDDTPPVRVVWEVLEQVDLWESSIRPAFVTVVRTSTKIKPRVIVFSSRAPGSAARTTELSRPVSRSIYQAIAVGQENTTNFTCVRPGSFRALKTELEAHYPGHFNTIHLDVLVVEKHSRQSDSKGYREFISNLLRKMNFSLGQSKQTTETPPNLQHCFFFTKFATSFLPLVSQLDSRLREQQQYCWKAEAARVARQHTRRDTDSACDFFPLIYINRECGEVTRIPPHMAYQQLDQGKAFLNASSLRGREIDTLHIEALLLLGAPSPLLIYGMAGIGKTALLDHLRRWWETSGMVGDSIHIYLGANEPFNKNNMLSRLEDHFIRCCCSTDDSKPSLFDHLGSHKCLIIFDDLDKAALGRQKGQFLNLTTKLAKSGALVIMSSRKRETWLSKAKAYQLHGVQTRLAALSTIDGIFNVDGANKKTRMQRLADKTEEEKDSLEGVVEVLGGSPQVIELLARSDLYSSMAPKEIYLSLLGIPTDKKVDPASKGRSPSGSDVEEQPRSITSFTEIYEKLSPICTGEGFLPLLLAPFINTIPYQDLPKILSIWSARVRHVLGDDASRGLVHAARGFYELHRHAFKLPENARDCVEALLEVSQNLAPREVPPSSEPVPLLREAHEPSKQLEALDYLLNTMCDRVATELTSVGLLGELSPVPEALKERGLMRLNPLINILSKNILVYKEDLFSVRTTVNEAFVLYYCSRGEKWPWSGFHNLWNQWAEAGTEIDFEFNNFASACIIGLVKIDLDTVNLMALLRIAAVLNRGEGTKSHYRKFVHFQVCTAALARSLAAMMKLQDEGVARQTEMFMFVVAAIWFSCELRRYHELDSKPDEEMSHRALVGKLATLASANVPSGIREALEVDEKSPEESFHKLALMAADSDASFRDMMHVHMTSNVFRFANPFDMKFYLKPGTTTSALSELDLVTMLSYSAEVGQYTSMVGSLREKIKQQEWAATDELVNQMLSLEINSEVSSCKSRIRTIQIQKKIAGQQRDDGRMNTLTEELSRLEQAMVEQNQKRSRQPWLER